MAAEGGTTFSPYLRHVSTVAADGVAAFATDASHVHAIAADGQPSFPPSFAGLIGRELVCLALAVSCLSTLTRNLTATLGIERGEAAPSFFRQHDEPLNA